MVRPILLDRCLSVSLSVHPSCPVRNIGVLWPNGWMDQDETWHGSRPQPRPHYVRRGPSSPKRGTVPQFSAHVCCGQTAGWTKMPLGREVGLCTGLIVLYGNPAPPQKRSTAAPSFWPISILAKRLPISAAAEHLYLFVSFRLLLFHVFTYVTNVYGKNFAYCICYYFVLFGI